MRQHLFHQKPGPQAVFVLCCAVLLAPIVGCSSQPGYAVQQPALQQKVIQQQQYGTVRSIQLIDSSAQGLGGGAILGAVLGGVVGNQFGSGSGRKVATGAGLIGGALAGNEIEKRNKAGNQIYRITVQLQNGQTQQFDYQQIGNLQIGDQVRVEGQQLFL